MPYVNRWDDDCQLYRLGDDIVETAVETYELLSNARLNVRAIEVWSIMQELAAYMSHFAKGETAHPAFCRAAKNLNRWGHTNIWGVW